MKTIKLFIAVLMVISFVQASAARHRAMGLYLTVGDYRSHKLSFENDSNTIRLNALFESGNVVLWHDGKKQVFLKKKIFGYRYNNDDYRFFNNNVYKIIDTNNFFLYSRTQLTQQAKGLKFIDNYYFSNATNTVIQPLTIHNLETAFANNVKFKYSVEQQFRSDYELMAYDHTIKMYKLKYLFDRSLK